MFRLTDWFRIHLCVVIQGTSMYKMDVTPVDKFIPKHILTFPFPANLVTGDVGLVVEKSLWNLQNWYLRK